jgi:S1-C subfamily serine protease
VAVVFLEGTAQAAPSNVKYKGFAIFPLTGEELYADVEHNLRTGVGKAKGRTSKGVGCQIITKPAAFRSADLLCTGQVPEARLTCDDGRDFIIPIALENCVQGAGVGFNKNDPDVVYIAFGGVPLTLKKRAIDYGDTVIEDFLEASKRLPAPAQDGLIGSGSGFYISDNGILVTNHHVIKGGNRFLLVDPKHQSTIPAKLLAEDPGNDLAILKSDTKSKPIPIAAAFNLKRGEDVLTLGYPKPNLQGNQQKATFGRVNADTGIMDDVRYAQVDLPIQPGNSGGPLIGDNGVVIGVITSTLNAENQNVNYALKIDYLFPLLAQKSLAIKPSAGQGQQPMPQLVENFEDSVVMVLTFK